jgi:hypothetical protein
LPWRCPQRKTARRAPRFSRSSSAVRDHQLGFRFCRSAYAKLQRRLEATGRISRTEQLKLTCGAAVLSACTRVPPTMQRSTRLGSDSDALQLNRKPP